MRRLALVVVVGCMLTPLFVSPVAADVSFTTLTTNANLQVGASHTLPNGAYGFSDGCQTGYSGTTEFRCSFEFDLSSILSSAKITEATLTIRRTVACATNDCPIDIASFTGNGSADLGDVTACCDIFTTTPTTNLQRSFNVLSWVVAHRNNGERWAGFHLARSGDSTRNPDVQDWSLSNSDLKLTIGYIPFPVDVTVLKDGDGTGNVVSNSPGIDCGSTCTGTFTYSQPLTLTAEPTNGSTFVTWSGITCTEGNQSTSCSFIVPSVPGPITATFSGIGPPISQPPPNPTPTTGTPSSPGPSGHATPKPSSGPGATTAPGQSAVPAASSGASLAPAASDPSGSAAPVGSDGPSILPLETPHDSQDTSGAGGVPIIPIVLVALLALAIGGGAWYAASRRQSGARP